jgi:hypothetical protein
MELIGPQGALDGILTLAPEDEVISVSSIQVVVRIASTDNVRSAEPVDDIVGVERHDDIWTFSSIDEVLAGRPHDGGMKTATHLGRQAARCSGR